MVNFLVILAFFKLHNITQKINYIKQEKLKVLI